MTHSERKRTRRLAAKKAREDFLRTRFCKRQGKSGVLRKHRRNQERSDRVLAGPAFPAAVEGLRLVHFADIRADRVKRQKANPKPAPDVLPKRIGKLSDYMLDEAPCKTVCRAANRLERAAARNARTRKVMRADQKLRQAIARQHAAIERFRAYENELHDVDQVY